MDNIAIKIVGVSKKYTVGKQKDSSLRGSLGNVFKSASKKGEDFWALKNISFDVKKGDVIGVIGKNGAGKSTLLKILSQITKPTKGRIEISGRIASLLEVGTGFHPELTGRENIYLNGTILGMTRKEVKSKFNEIVEFSGVEKFIDTPVKHYSSGMYVRLAFAVAAHLDPEILIIDEVLAVGDAEFQKKCLGKMKDVAEQGRTVIFVSHNMLAMQELCTKGVLIESGCATSYDTMSETITKYLGSTETDNEKKWDLKDAPGNENIKILNIAVHPIEGYRISINSGINFYVNFINMLENTNLDLTFELVNEQGIVVFHIGTIFAENKSSKKGEYQVKTEIPKDCLNAGVYSINLVFGENQRIPIFKINDVLMFEVENYSKTGNVNKIPGVIKPKLNWTSKFITNE